MVRWLAFMLLVLSMLPLKPETSNSAEALRPFHKKSDRCGYKDLEGRVVIEARFGVCRNFSEGVALVQERGKLWGLQSTLDINLSETNWGYIDRSGQYVLKFKPRKSLPGGDFAEGLASIYDTKTKKYGYIDHRGQIVISPEFDHAESFSEELAVVCSGEYHPPGEGFWLSQKEVSKMATHKCGFIGHSGELRIPYSWNWVEPFREGRARFREGKKFGYIDKTGKVVVPAN